MPISSPSDLLLNVELSTDIATQDELDSLATSIVGTPEDSEDEMTLNGLKKKDEILSERIGTAEEQASVAVSTANAADANASAAREEASALSGRVSGLEGRVQQVEENVQTLETGVQTAMANASAAVQTAEGADTKATAAVTTANNAKTAADAALTAIGELDGKVAALEQNDAEQDGRLDTIEGQIPNLALKTDIHDGALQVTVNGAGGFTFTANQAGNTSYDIVVPSTDDFVAKSDFDDLSGRVNAAEGDIDQLQDGFQNLGDRVTDIEGDISQLQDSIDTIEQKADEAKGLAEGAQSTANDAQTVALTAQSMAEEAQTKSNEAYEIANSALYKADNALTAAEYAQNTAEAAQTTANGAATSCSINANAIDFINTEIAEIMNGYYRYNYNRTPEGQHSQQNWYDSYIGSGECTNLYGNHYFPDESEHEGGVLYSSDRAQILITHDNNSNKDIIWYRTYSELDENNHRIVNDWESSLDYLPKYGGVTYSLTASSYGGGIEIGEGSTDITATTLIARGINASYDATNITADNLTANNLTAGGIEVSESTNINADSLTASNLTAGGIEVIDDTTNITADNLTASNFTAGGIEVSESTNINADSLTANYLEAGGIIVDPEDTSITADNLTVSNFTAPGIVANENLEEYGISVTGIGFADDSYLSSANDFASISCVNEISSNLSALSSELGNIAAILDTINGVNL